MIKWQYINSFSRKHTKVQLSHLDKTDYYYVNKILLQSHNRVNMNQKS